MKRLKDALGKTVHRVGQHLFTNELAQVENVVLGQKTIAPGMPEILRELAVWKAFEPAEKFIKRR